MSRGSEHFMKNLIYYYLFVLILKLKKREFDNFNGFSFETKIGHFALQFKEGIIVNLFCPNDDYFFKFKKAKEILWFTKYIASVL